MEEKNYDLLASKKKIWNLVGFFIVGWIMFILGITLMYTFVGVLETPILMIIGMVVLGFPTIKLVWQGAGIRALFNTDYVIVTTYTDGHQTTTYDTASNAIWKMIFIILTIALGIIITPIRILLAVLKYNKIQKQMGMTKVPFTKKATFPLLLTVISIIVMMVVWIGVTSIAEKNYFHNSSYSDKEISEIINDVQEDLKADSFIYTINDKISKVQIEVSYKGNANGGIYDYTVGQLTYYEYNEKTNKTEEKKASETEAKIPWGTYTYENGAFDETLSTDAKAILLNTQFTKLFDLEYMKDNLDKYVVNEDGDMIKIFYYYNGTNNEDHTMLELFKETKKINRVSNSQVFKGLNIMFEYE